MVPYRDNGHLSEKHKKFNYVLSCSCCSIERAFALLKGKFRRLKYLDVNDLSAVPNNDQQQQHWGRLGAQPLSSARQPMMALSCQTSTLSCQPSKRLAVLLSGLRSGLRLIADVSGRVCLHSFLRGKMDFEYHFTNEKGENLLLFKVDDNYFWSNEDMRTENKLQAAMRLEVMKVLNRNIEILIDKL